MKKKSFYIALILICLSLVTTGTWAYFTTSDAVRNVITAGGGVTANGYLRDKLLLECNSKGKTLILPPKWLCTDNAAMIGAEGYIQYKKGNFADIDLNAKARVDLA